jgi:putative multiple sugar transport system substrate-binding protein
MLILVMVGCGQNTGATSAPTQTTSAPAGGKNVTILMPTNDLAIWSAQGEELVKALNAAGFTTRLEYAENVIERQVAQIENAITTGADYIVIAPIDSAAISDACEKAKQEGIYVIANDRLILNTEAVDYYITFDLFTLGVMQGEYIEKALGLDTGNKGPFNMEIFSGSPDDPNAQIFYDGEMSILRKYIDSGVLVVKSGQDTFARTATPNWDTATAQARMDNLLGAYYTNDKVDVILAANDSTALGAISSLSSLGYGVKAGLDFPIITGQDCEIPAIKAIKEGKMSMSVFLDAAVLSEKVVEVITAIDTGKEVAVDTTYFNNVKEVPTIMYDPVLIDINNWELLIERGLYTAEELN